MLADWEREFPGRTEAIFSSLRNVELRTSGRHAPSLILPAWRRCALHQMTESEEVALAGRLESRTVCRLTRDLFARMSEPYSRIASAALGDIATGSFPGCCWRASIRAGPRRQDQGPSGSCWPGIDGFVDLTKPTELWRYDTHLPFYVEYTRKAIKDHGLPASRTRVEHHSTMLECDGARARPVYVHCRPE